MAGDFIIAVEMQGLDELRKKLKSETAAVPARRFLTRSANIMVDKATRKAPENVGTLKRSIGYEVSTETPVPTWVKVGTNVEYARFVEFGRKPGKQPPYRNIEYWYRRKNKIGPDDDVENAVNMIRRAIGRRGVEAQPFLVPAFEESLPNIQKYVYRLATEIEEAYRRGSQ